MAEKPRVLWQEGRHPIFGTKAPWSQLDVGTIRFTGATGLVGTAFGIPALTATRVATGHYRVHMARAGGADQPAHTQKYVAQDVVPTGLQGPTGVGFKVTMANRAPASGTVDMYITRPHPSGAAVGLTRGVPANPPAGGEVDLWVFTTPIQRY